MRHSTFALTFTLSILFLLGVRAQDQPAQQSGEPANPSLPDSTAPVPPKKVHVGGKFEAAQLIKQVNPKYPNDAKRAKICGTVVLHAIIGKDGAVHSLDYLSGPSQLAQAALHAVRQWRYSPAILEGRPVQVDTNIKVVFQLKGCKPAEENAQPQTQSTSPPAPAPQY